MIDSLAVSFEVRIDSALWGAEPEAKAIVGRALAAAAAACAVPVAGEVSVTLVDDAAIRELNRTWRGIDRPTNVLSFPTLRRTAQPGDADPGKTGERTPALLGDIVIAFEATAGEAEAEGKPLAHHLAHLAVHGFLHLLGYDHESDEDAEVMERLEGSILARLDVPDPYLTCAHEA